MPDNVKPTVVAIDDLALDEIFHAADCIRAYEAGQNNSYVNYVRNESLVPRQLAAGEVLNNRRINFSYSNILLSICAIHEKKRSMVCRTHIYFGSKAKNCKGGVR